MSKKTAKKPVSTAEEKRLNSRLQETPIAVVGMASIFADAPHLEQYWDNILDHVDSIVDVPADRWKIEDYYSEDKSAPDKTYCKRGAFMPEVDFDPMEFGLPPNILEVTDIAQLIALVVAKEVMMDAGVEDEEKFSREKIGITLGVGGGLKQIGALNARLQYPILQRVLESCGIEGKDQDAIVDKFKKAYIPWEENSFPGMLGNVIAGRVANRFNLGGTNCTVDAACAGALAAMKLAVSDLLEYRSDMMISGGICCDNSPFMYMSFSKTPAFTTNETIRPFDNDSKGMMVGEGAGMVMLKRLEDAERDGDRIYGVLKGLGSSSDGRFKSIYAPRPDGQALALRRAYEDAGFDPRTVGIIEGHGTGTLAGDAAEFGGLKLFFGENNDEKNHIALGSVKSQIGHTKSAAGVAGFIKNCLAVHHKVLPGTINVDKPAEQLNIGDSPFYINTETRPWLPRADGIPRRAGVSSFGFGGTNFHFIVEEHQAEASGEYRLASVAENFLFAAKDESGVKAEIENAKAMLNVSADDQCYVYNKLVETCALRKINDKDARLSFCAKGANELVSMLDSAIEQLGKNTGKNDWSVPTGIYYRSEAVKAKGKLVSLFSGQGSQYVNMGREAACMLPEVLQTTAKMDEEFSANGFSRLSDTIYPIPVFSAEDRKVQEGKLQLTQFAQPAIGTLSAGLFNVLKNAGFKTDFTAGHSFGELTALWAAGVLSDKDFMMLARSRGQAMAAPDDKGFDAGTMIAVVGDVSKVEALVKDFKDVSVANFNSNNQVVVAGSTKGVEVAFDKLSGEGYKVVKLPVSAAFHTPLVSHAQKPFAKAVDAAKFNKPKVPVFANGTGEKHADDGAAIKKVLKNHILEPVRFNKEIESIYNAGGRVFVEFGPKNVLTRLVDNILSDKDDVITIALNGNPKKSSDLQLRQAVSQLAVLGVDLAKFDPYQVKRPTEMPKRSPMSMKLSAASYVSDKTRNAYEDSLKDGYRIQSAASEPQIIEKIVERIVEVPVAQTSTNPVVQGGSNDVLSSIEQSVEQFYQHQKQVLDVHEQYMQGPKDYAETFDNVLTAQSTVEQLPDSVERTLAMYHDLQSDTLKVHEQYLNAQSDNVSDMMQEVTSRYQGVAGKAPSVSVVPVQSAPVVTQPAAVKTTAVTASAPAVKPVSAAPAQAAPVQSAGVDVVKIQSVMLAVVADKTGYPSEMLELSMDMEADLGIDSIKRVEILGAVQDEIPDLPELNPEDLAELRTLGQIVDYMLEKAGSTAPVATAAAVASASVDLAKIQTVMMTVVADKTGYPPEMLELSMDMEADLGIDSIKRVEILGAVQDEIPDLPELNPEDLAELRTLGQIVDYMQEKAGSAAPVATATAVASASVDLAKIQTVMMTVVADKTGYPPEMLELSMDMEADLGIDSIKRVEILGAVQDEISDLPELNPEDLAELRTLGQIVDYMQSKAGAGTAVAPAASASVDLAKIQTVMMTVVADKTGYPPEMLELSMDMEADLGIDSIKRVEILGAVQDEIPDLPELNPEDLAELRTLGQIVDYMQSKAGAGTVVASAPVASASVDVTKIQSVMMSVVAEKTGYPSDMLELSMDMEADLGIDSIKRVEILGAVQDEIPNLPELNPEDLAELRTLGQIVEYMQSKAGGSTPSVQAAPVVSVNAVSETAFSEALITVVSEKTGYPAQMLELDMDMEADLGIDSIKRVEILGAVQDALPGLPEVNAETLAEMRTLAEIVDVFVCGNGAPASAEVTPINSGVAVAETSDKAPSATVAIERLSDITMIDQSYQGANCLLVDDGHGTAVKLADVLLEQGAKVSVVVPSWVKQGSKKTFAAAVNQLALDAVEDDAIKAMVESCGQLDTVVYMQPKIAGKGIKYSDEARQGLTLAFMLAKHCGIKNATAVRPAFVVITHQGGQFGFLQDSTELVQAGLSGLVKTIAQEWPNVFCRTIDVSSKLTGDKLAALVADELNDADCSCQEVGLDDHGRLTLVPSLTDSYSLTKGEHVSKDSVFLVSGGAKGVTAHCVIELAKTFGSKFILLGRSSFSAGEPEWAKGITGQAELNKGAMQALSASGEKPTPVAVKKLVNPVLGSREIAATLDAIKQAGGEAEYISVDVTDSAAMKKAVKPVASKLGKITGLIHGAGVLADKFIEQKTLDDFNAVFNTKINGLTAMLSVVNEADVKHLVLFSSAAGFYGNPGQSDYSIANEVLNKTAIRFKQLHPDAQVLSFNWGPWDGGMVTPELKRMFAERGVYVIPIDAGAKLMASELGATDNRCAQILVGNAMSGEESSEKKQVKVA